VIDVSRYPDMADLLLAADILVTDYSSAMFDFACTGRPIVLFCPDLERYRDQVRGFYLDLEACAPGPLVATSDQVADALRDDDPTAYKLKYRDFQAAFCPWDDGHAASRVVTRLLAS
jgi:CDP-glycerol glycerophosphotransferase